MGFDEGDAVGGEIHVVAVFFKEVGLGKMFDDVLESDGFEVA